MTFTYSIPNDLDGKPRTDCIFRNEDSAWIPTDPANSDYQAYLATLASESQAAPTAQFKLAHNLN